MFPRKRIGLILTSCALGFGLLLAPAVEAGGTPPPLNPKQAAKKWKQMVNSHIKFHKSQMNVAVKGFCDGLKQLQQDVSDGNVLLPDVVLSVGLLTTIAQGLIMGATDTVLSTIESDGSDIQDQVGPLQVPLIFFLAGTCTTLDTAGGKVRAQEAQAINKIVKKLKSFFKKMGKKMNQPGGAQVAPPGNGPPPAPNPGGAQPPQPKELKIDSSAGSSSTLAPNDGKACVGGSADPAGGQVTVTIVAPNGTPIVAMATVDPGTCRWSACFGGAAGQPGTLAEGNYKVTATQGTDNMAKGSLGVP